MAQEVKDVLCCVFQVIAHYGLELELEATLEQSYQNLEREGFIE